MSLNPITTLSDQLQKLINERGSAAILRDHLALFKDKIVLLEQKAASLESENNVLKTENEKLKSEAANLRIANNELAAKIKEYENPVQKTFLDEPKINILKFLFSHDKLTTEQVATSQKLQPQTAQYHLVELANLGMISSKRFSMKRPNAGPFDFDSLRRFSAWVIMQPGRKYLLENKLVS